MAVGILLTSRGDGEGGGFNDRDVRLVAEMAVTGGGAIVKKEDVASATGSAGSPTPVKVEESAGGVTATTNVKTENEDSSGHAHASCHEGVAAPTPQVKVKVEHEPGTFAAPDDKDGVGEKSAPPNSTSTPTLSSLALRDASLSGLVHALTHRTPLYVFLSRQRACLESSDRGSEACSCGRQDGKCGGLARLPCTCVGVDTAVRIAALGVGWAFVDDLQVIAGSVKGRWKVRAVLQCVPEASACSEGSATFWWARDDSDDSTASNAEAAESPQPSSSTTSSKESAAPHLVPGSPQLCPRCACIIPHLTWAHWTCPACEYSLLQKQPTPIRLDYGPAAPIVGRDDAMRIDCGRAMFDRTEVTRSVVSSVAAEEGTDLKCAEYHVGAGGRLAVLHFLANGRARDQAEQWARCLTGRSSR